MKALDKGWVVESNFRLRQVGESGELRLKRSVLKLLPSAKVHVTHAEATKKLRPLCASGLFKFVGVPFAEADRICDPVGVTGRAPNLPDTTGHLFLGQVIKRVSCFLRLDAASKLTNQVEESFTGAEGLTKLYSMVPFCDLKKIDLVSSQLFCHVQLVVDSRTEQSHRAGHEGSPWQRSRIAGRTSRACLQQSQRWRKRQQWSIWQVERESYRPRLRQEKRRCLLRLKGPFFVQWFTGVQKNPISSWRVELVASIVLRYWVVPFGV